MSVFGPVPPVREPSEYMIGTQILLSALTKAQRHDGLTDADVSVIIFVTRTERLKK